MKSSDSGKSDEMESGSDKLFNYREFEKFKSPALADEAWDWLDWLRDYIDFCIKRPINEDDDEPILTMMFTLENAGKKDTLRDFAESCLKFYNEEKGTNFRLVKLWKANVTPMTLNFTFSAQEDGIQQCPLFRGAFWCLAEKPVFCEMKDVDEVTLLPTDDDYAQLPTKEMGTTLVNKSRSFFNFCTSRSGMSPPKKMKSSDSVKSDEVESGSDKQLNYREFEKFKYPALTDDAWDWVGWLRDFCDLCMTPIDGDDDDPPIGEIVTMTNVDKDDMMRDFAESCLKLYNKTKETNFRLVKLWKVNMSPTMFNLTFSAQEDGSQLCPFFRGAIRCSPKPRAVFCEMKDEDTVTLLPSDSKGARLGK